MFSSAQPNATSLVVIDSEITTHTDKADIWMPPFKLLAGGSRATLLMTRNNSWFVNSTVTSNNWGAISQDSVDAFTYVINSSGTATEGGYGTYLTYGMMLYASQLYGGQYGAFQCGDSILVTGTAADALADPIAMSKTPDYVPVDQPTVIAAPVNAIVVHTSIAGLSRVAIGNFKDALLSTMPEDLPDTVTPMAADDPFFMQEGAPFGAGSGAAYFYNRNLYEDNFGDPDDLYDMVLDGKWTVDAMRKLMEDVYHDVNGDGTENYGDILGMGSTTSSPTEHFAFCMGYQVTERDKEGFPALLTDQSRNVEVFESLYELFWETEGVYIAGDVNEINSKIPEQFVNGNMLFFPARLSYATTSLRDMKDDYGIIPYPKYDTKQSDYYSSSKDELSVFVVPVDVKDTEKTGIITEALCITSNEMVVPTYYEIVLKDKMSRDAESTKMIDIIRDSLIFDFGYLHSNALGGVGHVFVGRVRANANDIVSTYDGKEPTYLANLEKLMEVYK